MQEVRLFDTSHKYDVSSLEDLRPRSGVFGRATGGETEVESRGPRCRAVFGRATGEETAGGSREVLSPVACRADADGTI